MTHTQPDNKETQDEDQKEMEEGEHNTGREKGDECVQEGREPGWWTTTGRFGGSLEWEDFEGAEEEVKGEIGLCGGVAFGKLWGEE